MILNKQQSRAIYDGYLDAFGKMDRFEVDISKKDGTFTVTHQSAKKRIPHPKQILL